jgi:exopolysaccharide biosynthesis polyprenyl glycosylphosphotransferase
VKGYYSIKLNKHRMKLALFDFLMLFISIFAAYFLRYLLFGQKISAIPVGKIAVYYLALAPQTAILFYILGLYDRGGVATFSRTVTKLALSVVFIGMVNGLILYFYHTLYIGRVVFFLQLTIFFLLIGIGRFFIIKNLNKKVNEDRLILINLTEKEREMLNTEPAISNSFRFVEFNYENLEELTTFIKKQDKNNDGHQFIFVISSQSEKVNNNIDFFIHLKFDNYTVYDIETFYSNITGKIPLDSMAKLWNLISENEFVMGINSFYKIKRMVDIIVSALLLLLTSPLFIVIPILIKLSSRGPVFYTQERLGMNKKPFKLVKFRTMDADAEKHTGPRWASADDPRINAVGKVLRYTRLDELPQLVNVLKNDMSFVGNRPIREHFSEKMAAQTEHYDLRYFIKPGLTGWAQVNGSYAVPEGEKTLQYELFYLKNMGILFDLVILLKTLRTIFNLKGR